MNVKFAATSRPGSPSDLIDWVTAAENLGYHRIGVADSPALYREVWVSVTQVALNTSKIPFGPWVTNPISRHPVVTASAAAAIDEIAPGRICIGIGSGNSGVYNLGHKASPVSRLKEYIQTVRCLLEHGEAVYQDRIVRLGWADKRIPIYVAAHAVKSLRLAGQIADGVIIGTGTTPDVVKGALRALREGASSVGRSVKDIDVWWSVPFNIQTDNDFRLDPQGGAAREANYLARFTLDGKFISSSHKEGIKKLAEAYDLTTHGRPKPEQLKRYDRLAEEYGVKAYLEERFGGISGTPEKCIDVVQKNADMGITQYSINVPDLGRQERLKSMMNLVINRL